MKTLSGQFTAGRILLATFLAAIPIALHASRDGPPLFFSALTSLAFILLCLFTEKRRLDWVLGILMFTVLGFLGGAMFPSLRRSYELPTFLVLGTCVGAALGWVICTWNYRVVLERDEAQLDEEEPEEES